MKTRPAIVRDERDKSRQSHSKKEVSGPGTYSDEAGEKQAGIENDSLVTKSD